MAHIDACGCIGFRVPEMPQQALQGGPEGSLGDDLSVSTLLGHPGSFIVPETAMANLPGQEDRVSALVVIGQDQT